MSYSCTTFTFKSKINKDFMMIDGSPEFGILDFPSDPREYG